MNAPPGSMLNPVAAAHARATDAVNAWRGRCLGNFASVEIEVTRIIVALASTRDDIALGQLFGQRLAALEKAAAADKSAADVVATLAAFMVHEPLRSFLAHGDARVTIDRSERWQAVFTTIALKRRQTHSAFLVIDEGEAKSIIASLGRDRRALVNCLRRWHETLTLQTSGAPDRVKLRIGGAAA